MTDRELKAKMLAEIKRMIDKYHFSSDNYEAGKKAGLLEFKSFIKSLPEEPVSEDLEEAAEEYTKDDTLKPWRNLCKDAFKAGAKWQKLKIIYNAIVYNDKVYPTTYENEPTEFCLDGGEEVRLITEAVNSGLLKQGDKVKVIIIKSE